MEKDIFKFKSCYPAAYPTSSCGCDPYNFNTTDFYSGLLLGCLLGMGFDSTKCINPVPKDIEQTLTLTHILNYSVAVLDDTDRIDILYGIKNRLRKNKMLTLHDVEEIVSVYYKVIPTKDSEHYIWFGESIDDVLKNPNSTAPCKLYFKPCTYVERKD